MIDLKAHVVGDVAHDRRPRARSGRAGVADRVRQRVEPARRARDQPAPRARRAAALGASRGARRPLPARGKRGARAWRPLSSAWRWRGWASDCFAAWAANYFPRTAEIASVAPSAGCCSRSRPPARCCSASFRRCTAPAARSTSRCARRDDRRPATSPCGGCVACWSASQFAIATPLLVVAGLLLVSLNELARVDLGFDTHNVLTGSILAARRTVWGTGTRRYVLGRAPTPRRSAAGRQRGRVRRRPAARHRRQLQQLRSRGLSGTPRRVAAGDAVGGGHARVLRLLGLTLVEGRLFDERDGRSANLESVVVDRAWARRFFPNRSAVGKRFREGGCTTCPWTTVVGVVSEVKYAGLDKPDDGTVYRPMAGRGDTVPIPQATTRVRYLLVRTDRDAMAALPSVRRIVRELDPSIPLSSVATDRRSGRELAAGQRSLSTLIAVAGRRRAGAVDRRHLRRDGVLRPAAREGHQHPARARGRPVDVLRLVVGQGMKVVAGGVALGLLAAVSLTRLMASLLFGVSRTDAFTLTSVCGLLLATGLLACYVPARRAIGLEPAAVLRQE